MSTERERERERERDGNTPRRRQRRRHTYLRASSPMKIHASLAAATALDSVQHTILYLPLCLCPYIPPRLLGSFSIVDRWLVSPWEIVVLLVQCQTHRVERPNNANFFLSLPRVYMYVPARSTLFYLARAPVDEYLCHAQACVLRAWVCIDPRI